MLLHPSSILKYVSHQQTCIYESNKLIILIHLNEVQANSFLLHNSMKLQNLWRTFNNSVSCSSVRTIDLVDWRRKRWTNRLRRNEKNRKLLNLEGWQWREANTSVTWSRPVFNELSHCRERMIFARCWGCMQEEILITGDGCQRSEDFLQPKMSSTSRKSDTETQ